MNKKILTVLAAIVLIAAGLVFNAANAGDHSGNTDKPWICHPVAGKGETGNGWNLIDPSKDSSHIDESLYPDGHYWQHEFDGRHDVYANDANECPSPVEETDACPNLDGVQQEGFSCTGPEPEVSVSDQFEESCVLGGRNAWSVTTTTSFIFHDGAWYPVEPTIETSPKQFTAWTPEELKAHGCTTEQPPTEQPPTTNNEPPTGILHDGEIPVVKHHKRKHHTAVTPSTLPNTGA